MVDHETDYLLSSELASRIENSTCTSSVKEKKSYDEVLDLVGIGKFHWVLVLILGWANVCDAVEVLCVSFLLPSAECELQMTSANKGWLSASIFIGMMFGGYIMATWADITGRRRVLLLTLFINGIFGLSSSFAQSYWLFLTLRIISGFGVGGNVPVIWAYYAEFQPRMYRGRMLSLLATFWMSGNLLVALLAWAVIPQTQLDLFGPSFSYTSWRIFVALATVPAFSAIFLVSFLPESPKYLLDCGKDVQCMVILQKMYKINNKLPHSDLHSIELQCDFYEEKPNKLKSKVNLLLTSMSKAVELFYAPLTRNTLKWIFINFTLSFGYYGLWMWFPELFKRLETYGREDNVSVCSDRVISYDNSSTSVVNFTDCSGVGTDSIVYRDAVFLALANVPGNLLSVFLMDKVGRRLPLATSMTVSAIMVFFIWFVTNRTQNLILSCLFAGVSVIAWNAMDILGTELFPTSVRATAFGFGLVFARIGAILGNVLFGLLIDITCIVPIMLVAGCLLAGGLASLLFPNTVGRELL